MNKIKHTIKTVFILIIVLLFFSCMKEEIPTLYIKTSYPLEWKNKVPCKIIMTERKKSISVSAKIKYRGGISGRYPKHSFSLELDKKYSLCGLIADDDWILNANYIDKTFMRHKISYDLFRQMNSDNIASECAFTNLEINDHYQGLYVLMEEINASKLRLDKSDTLAMLFKDPPIFYSEKLSFIKDSLNYYEQKYPKKIISDKTYYLEKFRNFIFESSDKEFAFGISQWIDIDNVLDWHILLLFSNNSDGIMKNFYLYKQDSNTPFRIAIWDYDHSFGRDGDNELNMMERELDCNRSVLFKRLLQIPQTGYIIRLKNRWFYFRQNGIISYENLKYMIDQNDHIITGEIVKNCQKWPVNNTWYYDHNDYYQEKELLLKFVNLRIDQLDRYFQSIAE